MRTRMIKMFFVQGISKHVQLKCRNIGLTGLKYGNIKFLLSKFNNDER